MAHPTGGWPPNPTTTGDSHKHSVAVPILDRSGVSRVVTVLRAGGKRTERTSMPPPADDFASFYLAEYASVVRLAAALLGSATLAEDVAQDAFLAASQRWDTVAHLEQPAAWIRRVAINRCTSLRRRRRTERSALKRIGPSPTADSEASVLNEDLWRHLRGLSAKQRTVLALVFVEDRSVKDVADILQCGQDTVRTHLRRGRAALLKRLGEH
jgi:RNA polymerase sigma factor (sigma-70 family)